MRHRERERGVRARRQAQAQLGANACGATLTRSCRHAVPRIVGPSHASAQKAAPRQSNIRDLRKKCVPSMRRRRNGPGAYAMPHATAILVRGPHCSFHASKTFLRTGPNGWHGVWQGRESDGRRRSPSESLVTLSSSRGRRLDCQPVSCLHCIRRRPTLDCQHVRQVCRHVEHIHV